MEHEKVKLRLTSTESARWPPSPGMIAVCTCLAVMLLVGAVLSPVLTAGLVDSTDRHYLHEVGNIWSMSRHEAGATFGRVHFPSGTCCYYQPITALSLMVDAYLTTDWASRAFNFHLTNLLLHLLNIALLFAIVASLSRSTLWAALCALIFGLHPLQVESVAWVAQRMTLLATFFSLLALICYLRFGATQRFRWFAPIPILYAAAVLSKPTFLGLPIVFLLLDVWPLRRLTWRPIIEKVPLFILMIACAALHLRLQALVAPSRAAEIGGIGGIELLVRNISSLATRIVWPVGLSPFHPIADPSGILGPGLAADIAVVALLAVLLFGTFAISRPLFVAVAGAVVMVLPALFNAPFSDQLLGDQYLYAVLLMPMLVWAAWLEPRADLLRRPSGRSLALGLAALAMVFSVRTYLQSHIWHGSKSLFAHTIALHPTWAHGYVGLVESFISEGDLDSALHYARKATDTVPDDPSTQFYLGRVLLLHQDGRSGEAIASLRKALASNPSWIDCLHHLGIALLDTDQVAEAIEHLQRARTLQPYSPEIRITLGRAYLKADRPASARGEFQMAVKQRNDPRAHMGLARAWAANDMPDYARRHLAAAVARDPRYAVLAARYPLLRRLQNQPGFESLIDTSESIPDTGPTDLDTSPPVHGGPGL